MPHQFVERVDALVDSDTTRLVEAFKDIHRHPELGFAETRTAGIVAQALAELGFAVTTVVDLAAIPYGAKGRQPRNAGPARCAVSAT